MVYMGTPYIFDIYMIRYGWLGSLRALLCGSWRVCADCSDTDSVSI